MIQASELRLGNLVAYNGNTYVVRSLSQIRVEADPLIGAVTHSAADHDFEYIELTQDWMMLLSENETGYLVVSSLERTSDSSDMILLSTIECYLHEDGFLRVCAYEYDKQPDGSTDISDDVITLGYRHIRYIHQLQNLYFDLSGKELPVPLTLKNTL